MPSPNDWNYYINFVLLAVTGRTGEADTVMSRYGASITQCAQRLGQHDFPRRQLYRGVLLAPGQLRDDWLPHEAKRTFLSWSEDRDLALWFAHRDSIISEVVVAHSASAQGYLLATECAPQHVLFHWQWAPVIECQLGISLAAAAALHPQVDDRQFQWNLATQHEVITAPLGDLRAVLAGDLIQPPLADLEHRYCFPAAREARQ